MFRASRLSSGNHLFPTQVLIYADQRRAVHAALDRPAGRNDPHGAHRVGEDRDRLLLSDVLIETSGGTDPIACHGHRKGDAARMKALIEQYQTDYYRGGRQTLSAAVDRPIT